MPKTNRDEVKRVFDAICLLAEELSTTPPQKTIAEHLNVSQQYVSKVMFALYTVGAIEWINRTTYRVVNATWEPPPDMFG